MARSTKKAEAFLRNENEKQLCKEDHNISKFWMIIHLQIVILLYRDIDIDIISPCPCRFFFQL